MNISAQSFIDFYRNYFSLKHSSAKSPQNIKALILAPHPDDECLMSSVALRLQLENKAQVYAATLTLGSNTHRQQERRIEFNDSCQVLGFSPLVLEMDWDQKLEELKDFVLKEKINFITSPHLKDHHPTHIKTGQLAHQLIKETRFNGVFLETEFWGELEEPNLLVEVTEDIFTLQFNALTKHVGEVSRNPYHLRLAANLVDNVRRGAERVNVLGSSAPNFAFGNLYKLSRSCDGELTSLSPQVLSADDDCSLIF